MIIIPPLIIFNLGKGENLQDNYYQSHKNLILLCINKPDVEGPLSGGRGFNRRKMHEMPMENYRNTDDK